MSEGTASRRRDAFVAAACADGRSRLTHEDTVLGGPRPLCYSPRSCLDGVAAVGGEVQRLLLRLLSHQLGLHMGQSPADGAGLLGAQVQRHVLLWTEGKEARERRANRGAQPCSERVRALLAYASRSVFFCVWRITVKTWAMDRRTTLLRRRLGQSHVRQRSRRGGGRTPRRTHIFDSLFGAPPVTLATRSCASSVFSSLSCGGARRERVSAGLGSSGRVRAALELPPRAPAT